MLKQRALVCAAYVAGQQQFLNIKAGRAPVAGSWLGDRALNEAFWRGYYDEQLDLQQVINGL